MRRRRVFQFGPMVLFDQKRGTGLLTLEDFKKWRQVLLPELSVLSGAQFVSAVCFGIGRNNSAVIEWEARFCERLDLIDELRLRDKFYDFRDEDAKQYLETFLSVYALKNENQFSVDTSHLVLPQDEPIFEIPRHAITLLKITTHKRRSLIDHALNRKGAPDREFEILEAAISRLIGSGEEFLLESEKWHLFSSTGITELDDEEAESYIMGQLDFHRYYIAERGWLTVDPSDTTEDDKGPGSSDFLEGDAGEEGDPRH